MVYKRCVVITEVVWPSKEIFNFYDVKLMTDVIGNAILDLGF